MYKLMVSLVIMNFVNVALTYFLERKQYSYSHTGTNKNLNNIRHHLIIGRNSVKQIDIVLIDP